MYNKLILISLLKGKVFLNMIIDNNFVSIASSIQGDFPANSLNISDPAKAVKMIKINENSNS